MIEMSGILDTINFIVISQLLFFGVYLFLKGNKISSTFFLKIHLFFQLISYINYFFWTHDSHLFRVLLPLSIPSIFLWAPTFYFYIRSRLYVKFVPSRRLLVHGVPALIMAVMVLYYLIMSENFRKDMVSIGKISFYLSKVQHIAYYVFTLQLIYRYRQDLKRLTSASEQNKLNWLFVITYGIALTSLSSLVVYIIPGFTDRGFSYILFFIFINIFFFKAILQPDQFLGIDERKLLPVKLSGNISTDHFRRIDDLIKSKQLYLDPDLSLHNVAQSVKLSDRIVSQVIKLNAEQNFTDFINTKRIEYAKEMLRRTTKAEKNVLEILYDAGFNSKSVFNTQFKKHTGMSPSEFREKFYEDKS
jgi:AraC-like DNA-binding protein